MTEPTDHSSAYREGLKALLDEHDARRHLTAERASALDAKAQAELVSEQFRELFAGHCEATGAGCRASGVCREQGDCTLVGTGCLPRNSEDCRKSSRCKRDGWCVLGETEHGDMYCVDRNGRRPGPPGG